MFQKVRVAVIKNTRPVYLAGLMSSLFFAVGMQKIDAQASLIARHGIYTGIFFLCMWAACRLFATGLNRRLELEGYSAETAGDMIYTFVIYLEIIKHVVGVSFTLGWIAGMSPRATASPMRIDEILGRTPTIDSPSASS